MVVGVTTRHASRACRRPLRAMRWLLPSRGFSDNPTVLAERVGGLASSRIKHQVGLSETNSTPEFLAHPRTCSLIGMPLSFGQPKGGTDQGPALMRKRGVGRYITDLEWRLDEQGDVKFDPPSRGDPVSKSGLKHSYAVGNACHKLARRVRQVAQDGNFSLVVGGDHSIALGSVSGVLKARPETRVLWVDAHADINTPSTSPSGNLHGMPVAFLLKLIGQDIPGYEWLDDYPTMRPDQIAFVGLRDVDPGERSLIAELGIRAYSMYDVDRYGIGPVMEDCLQHLSPDNDKPLHLSYDIDAVDPDIAPATGTMVRGGFSLREAHYIAERLAETGMLGSMDIVEVNPMLTNADGATITADLGVALVASALGNRIL